MNLVRYVPILLVLCMLLCNLVGCGNTATDTENTDESIRIDDTATDTDSTDESIKTDDTTADTTKEDNETEIDDLENQTALNKNQTYEILFIGNSYTFYNATVPAELASIVKSAEYSVNVDSVTKGAWSLEQFADPNDEMGKQVVEKLLSKQYDFVVLQEQSHAPVSNPEKFYSGARALVKKIEDCGATPVFYCTWGRKAGNADIVKYNLVDNETMTWNLAAAYTKMGKELDAPVAYVGPVFYDIYTSTEMNIYHADGSHPSALGTYIAAFTIACTIFKVSPEDIVYNFNLPYADFEFIKDSINKNVFGTPEIPDKYLQAYGLK